MQVAESQFAVFSSLHKSDLFRMSMTHKKHGIRQIFYTYINKLIFACLRKPIVDVCTTSAGRTASQTFIRLNYLNKIKYLKEYLVFHNKYSSRHVIQVAKQLRFLSKWQYARFQPHKMSKSMSGL
jgi:hypothetical protein